MKQGLNWKPPENTLESLKHGMEMFDGVEFDVRITADDRLIVITTHHRYSSALRVIKWLEEWHHDDLVGLGFLSFDAFSDDSDVVRAWRDEGKMGCVEIKRHRCRSGGGFLAGNTTFNTLPEPWNWRSGA